MTHDHSDPHNIPVCSLETLVEAAKAQPGVLERLAEHLSARPYPAEQGGVADWLDYSLNRCGLLVVEEHSLRTKQTKGE